jgi:hypothetical protein
LQGNILLQFDKSKFIPKYADFGNSTQENITFSYAGTIVYDAPGIIY